MEHIEDYVLMSFASLALNGIFLFICGEFRIAKCKYP